MVLGYPRQTQFVYTSTISKQESESSGGGRKEGNILFNDALNTFYLWLYGVRHMVNDHSDIKWWRRPKFWVLSFVPHLKYAKREGLKALSILNSTDKTEW